MTYPLEKYKFYIDEKNRKVIAISTYAGRYVKGVAKCDPRDEFDIEKGKELAAARCAVKVAEKRVKNATKKYADATKQSDEAFAFAHSMLGYVITSQAELLEAKAHLKEMV